MKTNILKPAEMKALTLGIGLITGYLALSVLITVYFETEYKHRLNAYKNQGAEKVKQEHITPVGMRQ